MSDGPLEEARRCWNLLADDWRIQVGDEGDSNRRLNSDPVLWEFVGGVCGLAVLDAGCGTGYLSRKLRERCGNRREGRRWWHAIGTPPGLLANGREPRDELLAARGGLVEEGA